MIGPVCLDKAKSQESSSVVSVNRLSVQREEPPDSCITNVPQASNPLHKQDSVAVLVNKLVAVEGCQQGPVSRKSR